MSEALCTPRALELLPSSLFLLCPQAQGAGSEQGGVWHGYTEGQQPLQNQPPPSVPRGCSSQRAQGSPPQPRPWLCPRSWPSSAGIRG